MKKFTLVFAVLAITLFACNKQASIQPAPEKTVTEKMTIAQLKEKTKGGIDLIKAWEESKLPAGFVARVNKGNKPQPNQIITVTWGAMPLTSVNNGDGTDTHTYTLPANPKFSAMQHADNLTTAGLMDFSETATGVYSYGNIWQESYFLAGLPYVTSITYPHVGGYHRVWATVTISFDVFVSDSTNP